MIDATQIARTVEDGVQWCKRRRWLLLIGIMPMFLAVDWLAGHFTTDMGAATAPQFIPSIQAGSPANGGARLETTTDKSDAVVSAERSMLKIAERQSKSDYKLVQDLTRQVNATDTLARAGWFRIDWLANGLSADTLDAYHRWKAAVMAATPPKYSVEDVKKTTRSKAEFSSPQALKAKARLLNTAEQIGGTDKAIVNHAIKSIETKGNGWSVGDLLMADASFEVRSAYQQWKAAVFSAQ